MTGIRCYVIIANIHPLKGDSFREKWALYAYSAEDTLVRWRLCQQVEGRKDQLVDVRPFLGQKTDGRYMILTFAGYVDLMDEAKFTQNEKGLET